ncbi:MAG: sensor histidine kinase, partial [Snowella sp.]
QAKNESLQMTNQNKSEFLSHINHELRTPLTGILGFSRMLVEEIYGPLNDKQKQYMKGIVSSGEHLMSLINDFLDISKIEANREELFLERIAVEDVCLSALSMLKTRAKEQNLELKLEIGPNVEMCVADQRRLRQILLNLLSNAIKFTEIGSVTLKVEYAQDELIFSVIDTGIGIKPSDQAQLFQPFQQIHSHLSRKHKGTGLGLALSRKLAQLHGGDLTLTSEMGKGSCFTLNLPFQSRL